MSIRRTVRQAIKSGSSMYATVEAYRLGRATVRLQDSGARLTNLSTIGGEVEPGQRVIVDYSAGITPIVRPEFLDAPTPELEPIAPDLPEEKEYEDIGCCVWHQGSYTEELHIHQDEEFIVPIGWNKPDYDEWGSPWFSGFEINLQGNPGDPYVLIPQAGKYLISISWNEWWANYFIGMFIKGHARARVLKNGGPIGEFYVRNGEGFAFHGGLAMAMIDQFNVGDKVSLELSQDITDDYPIDEYAYYWYDTRSMVLQYIPGSIVNAKVVGYLPAFVAGGVSGAGNTPAYTTGAA
jgi:hypothetical protein